MKSHLTLGSASMNPSLSGTMYLHPLGVCDGMTAQLLCRGCCGTRRTLPFLSDLLVLSLPSPEWFRSSRMYCIQGRGKVFNALQYRLAWTEISASTEMVMAIHKGNTVLWAEDGGAAIKWECHGLGGGGQEGWSGKYKWVI